MRTTHRPRFLDLRKIWLPLPGLVSILHRASGLLLVAAMPVAIWLLDLSLRDAQGFDQARAFLANPLVRAAVPLLVWSLAHHLLAGIRFLLLDLDIGIARRKARASSWAVLAVSLLIVVLTGAVLW